jgi:hypothetical protein
MPAPVTPELLPHVDAVQAALEAVPLTVYVGGTPTSSGWVPPDKYCVLYPEPGMAVRESLADARTDFNSVMQITCVGGDAERALWVADRVRKALAATPLAVAGRACWPPEDLGGPPVARDDDVTPPVWFVPVQYRICSVPA